MFTINNACFLHDVRDMVIMETGFEDHPCQICGKPAKNFIFAAYVCNDKECIEKARIERGGPGGHLKRKAEGRPIIPMDPDDE